MITVIKDGVGYIIPEALKNEYLANGYKVVEPKKANEKKEK